MAEERYKPFFKVVDTYKLAGRLVLVSDRTDSGRARTNETIQVHPPSGGVPKLYKAGCVSFSGVTSSAEPRFCMAVKGVEPEEIPVGSGVWIEDRPRPIEDLSRYRKNVERSCPPMPQIECALPQEQKGKMETV